MGKEAGWKAAGIYIDTSMELVLRQANPTFYELRVLVKYRASLVAANSAWRSMKGISISASDVLTVQSPDFATTCQSTFSVQIQADHADNNNYWIAIGLVGKLLAHTVCLQAWIGRIPMPVGYDFA